MFVPSFVMQYYVRFLSNFAIIWIGKRELVDILVLYS